MILVTGSNGFVGRRLCATLARRGIDFRAAVRKDAAAGEMAVGDLRADTEWGEALARCSSVIHLAARVHVMSDTDPDPMRTYREVNVAATLNLARQAIAAGVGRFVFVSSVKVNGELTTQPFSAFDQPAPRDPYGQSKLEAELALQQLGRETGLEVVIVRPPLVYGPGVKANFLNLIKLVKIGSPLPFGCAAGRRSMVAVDNLVDLLIHCTEHPRAPGGVFMVSDGVDLTVGELVKSIAMAMNKKVWLVPIPPGLMRATARLLGASGLADRLLGSLQVDMTNTVDRLGWQPVVTPQAAMDETVAAYMALKGQNTR